MNIESVTARIDKRASDIYYRDIIGNITTSHVRKEVDAVNVELTMRFPMMGGWKTEFYWGYVVGVQSTHSSSHN